MLQSDNSNQITVGITWCVGGTDYDEVVADHDPKLQITNKLLRRNPAVTMSVEPDPEKIKDARQLQTWLKGFAKYLPKFLPT